MERACQRALEAGDGRYRTVRGILERCLEGIADEEAPQPRATRAFLRGPEAFAPARAARADVGVAV